MQKHQEDSFPCRAGVSNRYKILSSSAAAMSTSARSHLPKNALVAAGISALTAPCVSQGDANRSESDDEKKSDNFEEDEKVEQLRDTGKLTLEKIRPRVFRTPA